MCPPPFPIPRRRQSKGLALILVVGVLTVLLVIAMAFHQQVQLQFKAAVVSRDRETAESAAKTGVHQAIAFLQYDTWGANEKQAFVCAEPDGQLAQESGAPFPDADEVLSHPDGSVAFFVSTPKGFIRITRPIAKWRRPVVRIPLQSGWQNQDHPVPGVASVDGDPNVRVVETDLSWVVNFSQSYKQKGAPANLSTLEGFDGVPVDERIPILCGAPMHDEFLPGPFDYADLWELRTHVNRARPAGDARALGGQWTDGGWMNHHWAWPSMRKAEEFDYIDTRLCGDAVYRMFRSDLVAGEDAGDDAYLSFESGIDPHATSRDGIAQTRITSPRRYLHSHGSAADVHPQCTQNGMKATHLGRFAPGEIGDTRGGALNINQVNNNAAWERYRDPAGKHRYYNDAKWIYIYTPEGSHGVNLQRYAVTVISESGMPNANLAGPPAADDWPLTMEEAARTWGLPPYLRGLDQGFTSRGSPAGERQLRGMLGDSPRADWAETASSRLHRYVRGSADGKTKGSGAITSRAELDLVLRKVAFDESAGADRDMRERDARFLSHQLSVHGYENLLDEHWSKDRLVLDRGRSGAPSEYRSSLMNEPSANDAASVQARKRLSEILDSLRFTFGPDDAREGTATPYQLDMRADDATRLQARSSKALSIADLIDKSMDSPHLGQWTANAPSWWLHDDGQKSENIYLQLQDRKPGVSVGIHSETLELAKSVKPEQIPYQEEIGFVGAHGWAARISEVGHCKPRGYDEFHKNAEQIGVALPPKTGPNGWTFDDSATYDFIELTADFSAVDAPVRQQLMEDFAGGWRRHWKLLVMNPEGSDPLKCDVLKLPSTRILCIDMSCNPQNADNFGGDAETSDGRCEKTAMNRLMVFNPAVVGPVGRSNDGRGMPVPGVASFNHWMFRWRDDQPQSLTLRDVKNENNSSLRDVESLESFARAHPACYMLVLFKLEELAEGTNGRQIRWCCQRLNTLTDTLVLNAVDLPRESNPFEEGYEAIDLRNNRDGRISWRKTGDRMAVPRFGYIPRSGRTDHDCMTLCEDVNYNSGAFFAFTGSPPFRYLTKGAGDSYAWCDGLNQYAVGHYLPGGEQNSFGPAVQSFGRYDIEDSAGARSWSFAAPNEALSTLERYGSSTGFLQFESDLRKVTLNWLSYTTEARDGGSLIPDADLRSWGDLFRVTSLEQKITAGFLGGEAWGKPLDESMYWLYPAMDGLDNDLDGRIDTLTSKPRRTADAEGHYQSDRRAIGRMNLNELSGPAALWYAGLAPEFELDGTPRKQNLMTALGRRPHKGYVSAQDIFTKLNLQSDEATPYDALIWPENAYADLSAAHAHAREQYDCISQQRMALARTTTVSHTAVYTILCTGQSLDRVGTVKGEARVKVTVERTPEGRVNILEWAPMPE